MSPARAGVIVLAAATMCVAQPGSAAEPDPKQYAQVSEEAEPVREDAPSAGAESAGTESVRTESVHTESAETESAADRTIRYPEYVPPSLDRLEVAAHGGTRGRSRKSVRALAPDHPGLTMRSSPVLYWFLESDLQADAEFVLRPRDAEKPLETRNLGEAWRRGIHAVDLSALGVALKPGVPYRWSIALLPGHERVAGAEVQLLEPAPAGITQRLEQTPSDDAVFVYAEGGIWYDAVASLSALIEQAPDDRVRRLQRADLLEQGGIHEAAAYDREATTP